MTLSGRRKSMSGQAGVGLPTAIFVITVMALLAAGVNLLVSENAETLEEEIQLSRAAHAANSGAGFAMNALFPPEEFPNYNMTATCPNNVGSPRIYSFAVEGLDNCSAEVSCNTDTTVDGVEYYTINSTGTCGEISRTVQVRTRFDP